MQSVYAVTPVEQCGSRKALTATRATIQALGLALVVVAALSL